VDVNDAFLALTGYERDEIIGHSGAELNLFVDPDVRAKWMAGLREHGIVRNLEIQIRQKSGQIVYVLFSIARILANGQDMGLVLAIDITERKKAEDALLEANKTLQTQLNEIQTLQATLREQAIRDPLTGLYNRRYLYEMLERETARAQRDNYPISVAMIDIDHFKDFNDKHGHQAGDEILMALGNLLLRSTRQGDIACRYGGEEFIIIMPEAQEDDAKRRADEICRDFANLRIDPVQADLAATLSIGIALYPQGGDDMTRVIKAADAALYQAKQAGRNRVQVWKGK
jgi:diguanylate cyclase (GGDEF)-like protein/PAS domain S-box-containing protein